MSLSDCRLFVFCHHVGTPGSVCQMHPFPKASGTLWPCLRKQQHKPHAPRLRRQPLPMELENTPAWKFDVQAGFQQSFLEHSYCCLSAPEGSKYLDNWVLPETITNSLRFHSEHSRGYVRVGAGRLWALLQDLSLACPHSCQSCAWGPGGPRCDVSWSAKQDSMFVAKTSQQRH